MGRPHLVSHRTRARLLLSVPETFPTPLRNRYILLTVLQSLYAYFVEGDVVFVGRRKTLDKRVCLTDNNRSSYF